MRPAARPPGPGRPRGRPETGGPTPEAPRAALEGALEATLYAAYLCEHLVPLVRRRTAWTRHYGCATSPAARSGPPGKDAMLGTRRHFLKSGLRRLEVLACLVPKGLPGASGTNAADGDVATRRAAPPRRAGPGAGPEAGVVARFRCHEDPDSPGIGPRLSASQVRHPSQGAFASETARATAGRTPA